LARDGDPAAVPFPRAMMGPDGGYDFSFSGLKTAALLRWESMGEGTKGRGVSLADFAAGLQEAVVDVLVAKTIRAAEELKAPKIMVTGGVSANGRLRRRLQEEAD